MSRDALRELVQLIVDGGGGEAERDAWIAAFNAQCRHPKKSDLIFWPHGFPHDPSTPGFSVEEIVEQALTGRDLEP